MLRYSEVKMKVLPQKRQCEIRDRWLKYRLENLLPQVMKETGFDMWFVVGREYNEDPVMWSLFPSNIVGAPRITGLVMFYNAETDTVERMSLFPVGRKTFGEYFPSAWKADQETQWECLGRLVAERNPKKIGLDYSELNGTSDGISKTLYEKTIAALGTYADRVVSAEPLCIRWLETRTDEEMAAYYGCTQMMDTVIESLFSSNFIHPGVTTTDDINWELRRRVHALGLKMPFWSEIDIQRASIKTKNTRMGTAGVVVMPGDIVRCDAGLIYLGLYVDEQKDVYLLKEGETDAPAGLKKAMDDNVAFQDIVIRYFKPGKTGNQVLAESLKAAGEEGVRGVLYSHPIGLHGHAAGTNIGYWDNQSTDDPRGNVVIHDNTVYNLEMHTTTYVEEWGRDIDIGSEHMVALINGELKFLGHRMTEYYLAK